MEVVRAIHEGRAEPYYGARLISDRVYFAAGNPEELIAFYLTATEWEDATDDDGWLARRGEIEAEIRAEVDRWIASNGPPPGSQARAEGP